MVKVERAVIYGDKSIVGKMDPYCKVKYGTFKFRS